jgi:hypothetical protein
MPESSDEFLTSCGFKLDGAFDSVSLVSLAEHKEKQKVCASLDSKYSAA